MHKRTITINGEEVLYTVLSTREDIPTAIEHLSAPFILNAINLALRELAITRYRSQRDPDVLDGRM